MTERRRGKRGRNYIFMSSRATTAKSLIRVAMWLGDSGKSTLLMIPSGGENILQSRFGLEVETEAALQPVIFV